MRFPLCKFFSFPNCYINLTRDAPPPIPSIPNVWVAPKKVQRLLERYWCAEVFTFTLNCWCILFLARSHHLMGATHFISIYKAIQWCPQSSWQRGTPWKTQNESDKRLASSTFVFNSILFRKTLYKSCNIFTFEFQYDAVYNTAFAFPFKYFF